MDSLSHWEGIYKSKGPRQVSWYQERADLSLELIRRTEVPASAEIIDIGGGSSSLVDDLLAAGFEHVSVLDISQTALDAARNRLGSRAPTVTWIQGDIARVALAKAHYDIWHDRALFHFLIRDADRKIYADLARRSVKPGGHLIMATFALDGPQDCSGLPVMRYDADGLLRELGPGYQLVESLGEEHHTPFGSVQKFIYCRLIKTA